MASSSLLAFLPLSRPKHNGATIDFILGHVLIVSYAGEVRLNQVRFTTAVIILRSSYGA